MRYTIGFIRQYKIFRDLVGKNSFRTNLLKLYYCLIIKLQCIFLTVPVYLYSGDISVLWIERHHLVPQDKKPAPYLRLPP